MLNYITCQIIGVFYRLLMAPLPLLLVGISSFLDYLVLQAEKVCTYFMQMGRVQASPAEFAELVQKWDSAKHGTIL